MEKTGCKIICGAPTTLVVKGLMLMMMNIEAALKNVRSKELIPGFFLNSLALRFSRKAREIQSIVRNSGNTNP